MQHTRGMFLKKFITSPASIGSCTPSSRYTASTMLRRLDWKRLHTIVELGAGTGVFTQYIASHKRKDAVFLIIEQDPAMRAALRRRFPGCHIASHAEDLAQLLNALGPGQADCIISGLPFAVFPAVLRHTILRSVRCSLRPSGQFLALQYSPFLYTVFHQYFQTVHLGMELRNLPPAWIFYCTGPL